MDRPLVPGAPLRIAGVLAISILASAGCRSTKSEVPPGKTYARTGTPPSVGFSSDPHPSLATPASTFNLGPGGMADDKLAGGNAKPPVFGTPTPHERGALPTSNGYGPPGTSGVDPTAGATPGELANQLMKSEESASRSLTRDLQVSPAAAPQ